MGSSKRPLLRTPVRIEQQVRTADEGGGYALAGLRCTRQWQSVAI
jgi:hypothetical protein